MRRHLYAVLLTALGIATPAFAQADSGVFATFAGQVSAPRQRDHIAFEVNAESFGFRRGGRVSLVFLVSKDATGSFDPGLIRIRPLNSGASARVLWTHLDTARSRSSILIATLTAGMYDIEVRGERRSIGAYRVDVSLAGDANGDLNVDSVDLRMIGQLTGRRIRHESYVPAADVNRNGLIGFEDWLLAQLNVGVSTIPPITTNPLDVSLPEGALSLVNGASTTFGRSQGPLQFSLTGSAFSLDPTEVTLVINGAVVPTGSISVADAGLSANINLADGKNVIFLKAYDVVGRPLYFNGTLWAGAAQLRVNIVNPDGSPFLGSTSVTVSLSDDPTVHAQVTTEDGVALFENLPGRTVFVKARGANNETGTAAVIGTAGTVTTTMMGFGAPSSIANNDFSLGTSGWDIGSAPVSIVLHQETIPGFPSAAANSPAPQTALAAAALVDQDLMLSTAGEGQETIARSFPTQPGTTAVRIRYRFITTEVPGGYFGSEFNDEFFVSLRSQNGGGEQSEANSMNGLGLSAFDFASGSTNWREFVLPVEPQGDVVQVDVMVANVGDGQFPSYVVVDFVQELREDVRPLLQWNNTEGGLSLGFEVLADLQSDVTIDVHWARGAGYGDRLGGAVFSYTVPQGTAPGTYGPVLVSGSLLSSDPAGATHLIAASTPTMVGALPDARVSFGTTANAGIVPAAMIDIVRDGLRAAGQSAGTITSTSRTPEDQARAMFNNLVNPAHSVAANVQSQLLLYGPNGDAVINVFVQQTQGMTREQIVAASGTIRDAMAEHIQTNIAQWTGGHLADPAALSVVDVGAAPFNSSNGPLFVGSVQPRVTTFYDEPQNNCYHLELIVGTP